MTVDPLPLGARTSVLSKPTPSGGVRVGPSRSAAVDGVRGIGVLTVLLYHGGVTALAGAFLDMDMFFVTSGMLITMVLLRQYQRTRRIPLLAFWVGRARRLVPGLLGVLTLVSAYAYFLADPTTLGSLRMDMLSTLGFFANWHFINDSSSYFANAGLGSPLQHMWSLAIEEQFYVVWPIALMLWLRWRRSLRGLQTVLGILAVASAIYMAVLYVPGADPTHVYFNTFARVQSILVGCMVGIWITKTQQRPQAPARWTEPVAFVAFTVIVALPFLVDTQTHWLFRGGFLMASVLCGFGFASAFQNPSSRTAHIVRIKPLRWLGRLTYGLYIWHLPLYVILDEHRTGLSGLPLLVVRLGATIVVAWAFDRWVEQPVLRGALTTLRRRLRWSVIVGAFGTVISLVLVSTANAQPQIFGNALPGAIATLPGPMLPGQKKVVVLGDSVAHSLWWNFPTKDQPDVSVGASVQLGCGIQTPLTFVWPKGGTFSPSQCVDYSQRWSRLVEVVQPDVVVLVATAAELYDLEVDGRTIRNGTPEYDELITKAYVRALDVASEHGKRQVIVANIPCYLAPRLTAEQAKFVGAPEDQLEELGAFQSDPQRQLRLNAAIEAAVAQRPFASVLDQRSYLCPGGEYADQVDGVTMRHDGVHFTPQGAVQWWTHFRPQIIGPGT